MRRTIGGRMPEAVRRTECRGSSDTARESDARRFAGRRTTSPQGGRSWRTSSPARPDSSAAFWSPTCLKRGEPIYVLVRKGSAKKLAELRDDYWGANE